MTPTHRTASTFPHASRASARLAPFARPHGAPAVTIVMPLEAARPGNPEDPRRLAAIRADVLAVLGDAGVAPEIEEAIRVRLDGVFAQLDLEHPVPGVVVLVAPDITATLPLGAGPRASVTVGREFAFSAALTALQDEVVARVLLLSRGLTRCIEFADGVAVERDDAGFPVARVVRGSIGNPHEDLPAGEHALAEDALATFRAVAVASSVRHHDDPRELVLVGTPDDLATFETVRDASPPVTARIAVAHVHDTAGALYAPVRDALHQAHSVVTLDACLEAAAHIGHGAIDGIGAVWEAAHAGRGHRLLVEAGFRHPMHLPDDAPPDRPPATLGGLDTVWGGSPWHLDAVDETIAAVLRADGEVLVVPDGALTAVGRIVLTTRY
jgi:hypothetical protein